MACADNASEGSRAAGDGDEKDGHAAHDDRQREEPPHDQLECRKREEIERDRTPEYRIDADLAGRRGRHCRSRSVPVQRQRGPLFHQRSAGERADDNAHAERDRPEHRLDRQPQRLAVDHDGVSDELAETSGFQREKSAVECRERQRRRDGKDCRLEVQRLPEHGDVAQRFEPQGVDVIGNRRAAAEEHRGGDDDEQDPPAPWRTALRRRPLDGVGHVTCS